MSSICCRQLDIKHCNAKLMLSDKNATKLHSYTVRPKKTEPQSVGYFNYTSILQSSVVFNSSYASLTVYAKIHTWVMGQRTLTHDPSTHCLLWTPALRELHWLPVAERIQYKLCLLVYKSLLGHTPEYISDLTSVASIPDRSTMRAS